MAPEHPASRATRRPQRWATAPTLALLLLLLGACDGFGADAGGDAAPSAPQDGAPATQEEAGAGERAPSTADPEADAQDASTVARTVRTIRPEAGTLTAARSASASVEPARSSQVAASVNGTVASILARPGTRVEAGATVVRLEDEDARLEVEGARQAVQQAEIELRSARRASGEDASQAQASLQSARTSMEQARDALEDGRALFDAGGVSRSELRDLEAQFEQAESQWIQARDAAARAGRSESENLAALEVSLQAARTDLRRAQRRLEDTRLQAPFAGEVAETYVEEGEFIAAGSPAFRLESVDAQHARVDLPPSDAQHLRERGELAFYYRGDAYLAVPVETTRHAEQPRSVELTARIYPSDARIPNGARVELRYQVELAEGLLLPSSAVHAEGGETVVYRAADGFAVRTPVTVRAEAGGRAAVEGVAEDAPIISPRPLDVRDGTRIRVQDADG